jgi:hypothetical protein
VDRLGVVAMDVVAIRRDVARLDSLAQGIKNGRETVFTHD